MLYQKQLTNTKCQMIEEHNGEKSDDDIIFMWVLFMDTSIYKKYMKNHKYKEMNLLSMSV